MTSQRYSESRTVHEESRRGNTDPYDSPYSQRVTVPIERSINNFVNTGNEQRVQERIRTNDTTVQWVNDPISGKEKFRVDINIEGFSQNEVNIRVDGNKLIVYGEHVENNSENTAKKIIEKSFELPRDVDTFSPHVTFPTSRKMQVDFPSRHSNVIVDDGRTSSKYISNYDTPHHSAPAFTQQRSSTEYTSTRKLGGGDSGGIGRIGGIGSSSGIGGSSTYGRSSSPHTYSSFDRPFSSNNIDHGSSGYSSTSHHQSRDRRSPLHGGFGSSTTESFNRSSSPTYTYRVTTGDSLPRTTYPSSSRGEYGNVQEKTFSETHHETRHRRSSPTTGVQSSHEIEHHRSGSPSIAKSLDEERFRSSVNLGGRSVTPPSSSRNVEVREFSRRVGSGTSGSNDNTINSNTDRFIQSKPSIFAHDFNSDAFYRSAFQPEIFTDDHGQKRIVMKLDVNNYQPNEIKVSVNGNDLIVQAEHNVERPPTSTTRAYFYKQITLPPNTDLSSLASQYHPDGKLHISAKISHEQTSIRYN